MIEKKQNPLIIVTILIIILLFSLGYLGYYNSISKSETPNIDNNDNNNISEITNFPQTNDSSVKVYNNLGSLLTEEELKTNFTDIVKETDGIEFKFSCSQYNFDEDIKECESMNISINNKIFTSYSVHTGGSHLYKTDKYMIINDFTGGGVDNMSVSIYDLEGNLKYKNTDAIGYYYNEINDNEEYEVIPTIVDNKLYIVLVDKVISEPRTLKFSYVDLNDTKLKDILIQEFKAYISYEG